jgi:uncharacterized protein YecT (DUF1311 family)
MPVSRSALTLCLLMLGGLPCTAFSASAEAVLDECSAFGQAGMRECIEGKAHESTATLKLAEEAARDAIAKWDEDARFISAAKARLAASNKAFVRYRETHCALVESLGGGAIGNALAIRRLACVSGMNTQRAEALSASVAALPTK